MSKNLTRGKTPDITVIGAAIVDVLAGPVPQDILNRNSAKMKEIKISFGGDALNEAVVLSRMDKCVQLVTLVGQDDAGRQIISFMEDNNISTEWTISKESIPTGVNIVLVDENAERHFLTNPHGSLRKLSLDMLLPVVSKMAPIVSYASVFVSSEMSLEDTKSLFEEIKKSGRILACDFTSAKNGETIDDLRQILPYVDFAFPNAGEAAALTGVNDPYENAKIFCHAGAKCTVLKTGKKGCIIQTQQETINVKSYPAECVDTTGAGDCFAAGFLWAYSNGYSLKDCGAFACAAASCAVEVFGATDGIENITKPLERYNKLKNKLDN